MPHLYAESFAPWCEKARWALDHHGISYRYTEHVPMLGELRLRIVARRMSGIVTVPLLVHDGQVLMDSFAIARHAEQHGRGTLLFPPGREDEIAAWNEQSEIIMVAGRALLLPRIAASPAALREQLPPFVPASWRSGLEPLAASGVRHLVRKYQTSALEAAEYEARARAALERLQAALREREWLLDTFSFADITMATSLQFILPVAERYISLGPATREAWTHPGLAAEYADLLAWRDRLYTTHRLPRESADAASSSL